MSTSGTDTVSVPLSSNQPPYRVDDVSDSDCYVRIRRPGSDVLVLVPPGDDAAGTLSILLTELKAYATRNIATRRYDNLLFALLFVVVPLLLLATLGLTAAGPFGFPDGSVLHRAMPILMLAVLVSYLLIAVAPRVGLLHALTTVEYPKDPLVALRDMPETGIRYLTEGDFRDDAALEALRHDVLARPESVRSEEWAALWVLAARDSLYGSALVTVKELAQLRLTENKRAGARQFSAQMQVALEGFESATQSPPPTSPSESTDVEEKR